METQRIDDKLKKDDPDRPGWRDVLGPGLITGASDDDPSGIATYSQAGAQFGTQLSWTIVLSFPLLAAIQMVAAQIGRVTGAGLAGNMRRYYPRWLLDTLVGLLLVANTINLGADLGAMAAALKLLVGGPSLVYVALFGIGSAVLEIWLSYARYVLVLKWLTLSLLAYVATVLVAGVDWGRLAHDLVIPSMGFDAQHFTVIVALLGTTISPYLFFWQAAEEAEDEKETPGARPLREAPEQAPRELRRIQLDTIVGMGASHVIALAILVTSAATLHVYGITDIGTSAEAAEALRPIAGEFAFAVFALGIIGTGLLALPVLAGSAAFAVGEARGWRVGLSRKPREARAFYSVIAVSILAGIIMNLTPIDPVRALFWSAVINGVVAVPIMVMMMVMGRNRDVMGQFTLSPRLNAMGWLATAVMAAASIGMFATL